MNDDAVGSGDREAATGADVATNTTRRNFLLGSTATLGTIGVVAAAVPFVRSWLPSAKAKAIGAPLRLDISKLRPGELLGPIEVWRGQPIFVIKRTTTMLAQLNDQRDLLLDPDSERDQQPAWAKNAHRSRESNPEVVVLLGLCTHLGCSPKYYGQVGPQTFDDNWRGGFFCPCHGSKFDLAGRVYKNVPAPSNLVVPPYSFESKDVIVVGIDETTA